MKNTIRKYILSIISGLLFIFFFTYLMYLVNEEFKIKSKIKEKALNGDKTALYIIKHQKKAFKLGHDIVLEALEGNSYAFEIILEAE